jgi:hypothetical protein
MIVYEGPSLLTGEPIVAIVTTSSRNVKTGPMAQLWIMRADIDPVTASRMGGDRAVCGRCPHRGTATPERDTGVAANRACYVVLAQAPLSIWNSYRRGIYSKARSVTDVVELGRGRMIRNAAYGDGAAIPARITSALASEAVGQTAYSHNGGDPARYMSSVESESDARAAWARGERTFRIVRDVADIVRGAEIECPSERGVKCADCRLCGGAQVKARSIAIVAHGNGAKYVGVA